MNYLRYKPIDYLDKVWEKINNKIRPIKKRRRLDFLDFKKEIINEKDNKNNVPKLIFAIDDLCSLGRNFWEADFGGKENGNVVRSIKYLVNKNYKITAFAIPCPLFKENSELISSYKIRNFEKLPNIFIEWNKKGKIEIAQHGYKHMRLGYRGFSRSMEFEWKNHKKILKEIEEGYEIMNKNYGLIKGFKSPAWSIGQLNGKNELLKVCLNQEKFKYVCLSSPTNGLNYEKHNFSHISLSYPFKNRNIKNIPQNISILTPLNQSKELIKIICDKGGIVSIQTHASIDKNIISDGLSEEDINKIENLYEFAISCGAKESFAREVI